MGSASCKNSKSTAPATKNEEIKKITIGVFGLDNAGKTTAVKAIEGAPTKDASPTLGSNSIMVPYPTSGKGKAKSQERIEMIDVSGRGKTRDRTWGELYDRVHGFLFVIDASSKNRMAENQSVLNDLLDNDKLRDKPILILANKQDQKNVIKDEDHLRDKLNIEDLKRKHKIEFCTAIPKDKNKTDEAIRQGFSWLINEIESDYKKLNSRVTQKKNTTRPESPTSGRKSRFNNTTASNRSTSPVSGRKFGNHAKSDHSDSEDGIVYASNRKKSPPPPYYRNSDIRGTNTSIRLPQLDTDKSRRKPAGYDTYSDNDDHKDDLDRTRPRPNISGPTASRFDRAHSPPEISAGAASGFNKKKKVLGANGGNSDIPINKSTANEPKPFRSTYETFPNDIPWSSTSTRSTKQDITIPPKPNIKPPVITDPFKRSMSPLVRDFKPNLSTTLSKHGKGSDDEIGDRYNSFSRDNNKSSYPSIHHLKDDDNLKQSSQLTNSRSLSNPRKPLSGIHGLDDDDDIRKPTNNLRRPNLPPVPTSTTTTTTTKKPARYDDNSDNDNDYYKKPNINTTKRFDSDDDDKNINKNKPYDYHGTTSKSISPNPKNRFAHDDDDYRSTPAPKFGAQSKFNNHKDDDDDKYKPKPTTRSKLSDDDDYRSTPASKFGAQSKFNNRKDDDDDKYKPKPTTRSKLSDDDDYRSTPASKFGAQSKFNNHKDDDDDKYKPKSTARSRFSDDDDDLPSSSLKPITRLKQDDNNRPSSPYRSTTLPKYGDDNRSTSLSRFNNDTNRTALPSSKAPYHSKFSDDDDDRPATLSKVPSRSNFDDDDDDRRPGSLSKIPSRSKLNEKDDDDYRSFSPKKPTHSRFDDDDDDRPATLSKVPSRSKFDDDDDDLPSTSRGGSNSARNDSSTADRFRKNLRSDY